MNRQIALYALVLVGLYLTYLVLNPFLSAIVWAAILAILFHKVQTRLETRIGSNAAALVTTLAVTAGIVIPVMVVIWFIMREMPQFVEHVKEWSAHAPPRVQHLVDAITAKIPPSALEPQARAFLAGSFAVLGNMLAMLFGLFFMLRDGRAMTDQLRDALPFPRNDAQRLMDDTREMIVASIGAGAVVAAADALVGATAFRLVGIPMSAVWGVAMGFASFLPIVGTAIIWVPAALWLMWSGAFWRGVTLLLICGAGMAFTGNVLRPALLSKRTAVSGMVVFFGILGGAAAFGLLGLVIGPVILTTTSRLLKTLRTASA